MGVTQAAALLAEARSSLAAAETRAQQALDAASKAIPAAAAAVDGQESAWRSRRDAAYASLPPEIVDGWGSERWHGWTPGTPDASWLRIGELHDDRGVVGPVLVPFVGAYRPLVLRATNPAGITAARDVLRSLAVRTALLLGHQARQHLLDPYQEGRTFPMAGRLPDVAPRKDDVHAGLEPLFDECARITDTYPEMAFDRLPAEVRAYEKYNLVLAADFPRQYDSRAVQAVHRVERYAHAGALLLLHQDVEADRPGEYDDLNLRAPFTIDITGPVLETTWNGVRGRIVLDKEPPSDLSSRLLGLVADTEPQEPIVDWREVNAADPSGWWEESSAERAQASIGRAQGLSGSLDVTFGVDESAQAKSHVVQAGMTGSGKSVLFHSLILSLATRYAPDELSLYLIDGKAGSEFQLYRQLPHARVVSLKTTPELARSVLSDLVTEMERRFLMFQQVEGEVAVRDYASFRQRVGSLPRLVLVVDEYQSLFEDDRDDQASAHLLQLATQGRSAGIHLYIASQDFRVPGLRNAGPLFANFQTRIALQMSHEKVDASSEFDSVGRALLRSHNTHVGRAVVNDAGGSAHGNAPGKVALLSEAAVADIVAQLRRKAERHGQATSTLVLEGDAPPRAKDIRALASLASLESREPDDVAALAIRSQSEGGLGKPAWLAVDRPLPLVLGREMSVHGVAIAPLERRPGEHLVVVASGLETVMATLLLAAWSAAQATPASTLTTTVLSTAPRGGSWDGVLDRSLAGLLERAGHRGPQTPADETSARDRLSAAVAELDRRLGLPSEERRSLGRHLVIAAELDRELEFVQEHDGYGLEPSAAGRDLIRLIESGPAVGMHCLLGFRSVGSLTSVLPSTALARVRHRAYGQMSEDDSFAFLGTSAGFKVQPSDAPLPIRAGYLDTQQGGPRIFIPCTTAGAAASGESVLADDLRHLERR